MELLWSRELTKSKHFRNTPLATGVALRGEAGLRRLHAANRTQR